MVLDPVMVAESGAARLLDEDAQEALRTLLVPRAAVVTPEHPGGGHGAPGDRDGGGAGAPDPGDPNAKELRARPSTRLGRPPWW